MVVESKRRSVARTKAVRQRSDKKENGCRAESPVGGEEANSRAELDEYSPVPSVSPPGSGSRDQSCTTEWAGGACSKRLQTVEPVLKFRVFGQFFLSRFIRASLGGGRR